MRRAVRTGLVLCAGLVAVGATVFVATRTGGDEDRDTEYCDSLYYERFERAESADLVVVGRAVSDESPDQPQRVVDLQVSQVLAGDARSALQFVDDGAGGPCPALFLAQDGMDWSPDDTPSVVYYLHEEDGVLHAPPVALTRSGWDVPDLTGPPPEPTGDGPAHVVVFGSFRGANLGLLDRGGAPLSWATIDGHVLAAAQCPDPALVALHGVGDGRTESSFVAVVDVTTMTELRRVEVPVAVRHRDATARTTCTDEAIVVARNRPERGDLVRITVLADDSSRTESIADGGAFDLRADGAIALLPSGRSDRIVLHEPPGSPAPTRTIVLDLDADVRPGTPLTDPMAVAFHPLDGRLTLRFGWDIATVEIGGLDRVTDATFLVRGGPFDRDLLDRIERLDADRIVQPLRFHKGRSSEFHDEALVRIDGQDQGVYGRPVERNWAIVDGHLVYVTYDGILDHDPAARDTVTRRLHWEIEPMLAFEELDVPVAVEAQTIPPTIELRAPNEAAAAYRVPAEFREGRPDPASGRSGPPLHIVGIGFVLLLVVLLVTVRATAGARPLTDRTMSLERVQLLRGRRIDP